MKKIVLASVLGALAMFVWTFIAHMLLPLGEAGIKQIDHEDALLASMRSTIPDHGMYMFPNMPPGTDQSAYEKKIASGPSGLLIYFPSRSFNFGANLGTEFVTEFLQSLVGVILLSLTGISTFRERLGFFALVGLIAAFATNVSYWNWYGFPSTYTVSYMFTNWMAFVCAGLVAAAMKVGGRPAVAGESRAAMAA
jgi:hypothetical protein